MWLFFFAAIVLTLSWAKPNPCFQKNKVNAADSLPWLVNNVNGTFTATKPQVVVGSIVSDENILTRSPEYIDGQMKIAKISWCTETNNNLGRLVQIQASVKPSNSASYAKAKYLDLSPIGKPSQYCQSWIIDNVTRIQTISVFYDTESIQAVKFSSFNNKFVRQMGEFDLNSNIDKMTFDSFNSFVGFYAGLNKNGTLIKTLGTFIDTCEITALCNGIAQTLGQSNVNPYAPTKPSNQTVTKPNNQSASQPSSQPTIMPNNQSATQPSALPITMPTNQSTAQPSSLLPTYPISLPNSQSAVQNKNTSQIIESLNSTLQTLQQIQSQVDASNGTLSSNINVTSVLNSLNQAWLNKTLQNNQENPESIKTSTSEALQIFSIILTIFTFVIVGQFVYIWRLLRRNTQILQFNSRTLDDLKGIPTGTEITEVDGLPCSQDHQQHYSNKQHQDEVLYFSVKAQQKVIQTPQTKPNLDDSDSIEVSNFDPQATLQFKMVGYNTEPRDVIKLEDIDLEQLEEEAKGIHSKKGKSALQGRSSEQILLDTCQQK